MSSQSTSTVAASDHLTADPGAFGTFRTPIGVDVGVKELVVAAPVGEDPEAAFAREGDHIRQQHEVLVSSMNALHNARFDASKAKAQTVAAFWQRVRGQILQAAIRTVNYARQYPAPVVVLEELDLGDGAPLWEYRRSSSLSPWLLPTLQHAIAADAQEVGIPVIYVDRHSTSQTCYACGEVGTLGSDKLQCETDSCPVRTVCRDRNAALVVAQRGRKHLVDDEGVST